MVSFLSSLLPQLLPACEWLVGFFIVFAILERVTPCNKNQPRHAKACATDLAYYFIMPVFNRIISAFYLNIGALIVFHGIPVDAAAKQIISGFGPLGALPLWAQAVGIFVLSDVILYWTHRLFHRRKLWRWHAIHHSPKHVQWHTAYRFHPVNVWLTFTLVDTLMLLIGFSLPALASLTVINTLYSAMVHANLNWTFGPFKYLFASPVFHRWHHTSQKEGMDKNFAPTFPVLDIIFGTFYMPEGKLPEHYGVSGSDIPESFHGQMLWPFRNKN